MAFDLFSNLSILTKYFGCVANVDLPFVMVKVWSLMCGFAVVEDELRRPTVAEGRCGFFVFAL